jgi:hypothetical protein
MTKKKTAASTDSTTPVSRSLPGVTEIVRAFDKPTDEGKTIIEVGYGECRFPLGGVGANTRFCAKPNEGSAAYCGPHVDRMYTPRKGPTNPGKLFVSRR